MTRAARGASRGGSPPTARAARRRRPRPASTRRAPRLGRRLVVVARRVALDRRHRAPPRTSPVTPRSSVPRTIVSSSVPPGSRGVERLVQRVDAVDLGLAGGDDQIAALDSGALGGAAVLDRAHEHAVALGQADRAAQPPRDARRRDRDAEPDASRRARRGRARRRARASRRRRAARGSGRVDPHRVDPEQPAVDVDAAARRPSPAGAARCARSPRDAAAAADRGSSRGRGHEPGRHAQPAAAGVGEREHGASRAAPARRPAASRRLATSPVSTSITARSRSGSEPSTRPARLPAVGERDRRLVVAEVVSVRQHAAGRDHDAGSAPQPRPSPTTAGPVRSAAVWTADSNLRAEVMVNCLPGR